MATQLEAKSGAEGRKAGLELRTLLNENRSLETRLENAKSRLSAEKEQATSEAHARKAAEQNAASVGQQLRTESEALAKANMQLEVSTHELRRETKLRMGTEKSLRRKDSECKTLAARRATNPLLPPPSEFCPVFPALPSLEYPQVGKVALCMTGVSRVIIF